MREHDSHSLGRAIRDGFIAFSLMYPLVTHPVEAQRAYEAVGPGLYDCGDALDIDNVDAILVPGGGVNEYGWPNAHTRQRLKAAAMLYAQNSDVKIILLLGKPSAHDPLEGYGNIKYLQLAYRTLAEADTGIPARSILVEDNSINTATNMQEAARLAKKYSLERFLLVTQAYHADRATLFACNNGLHVSPRLVEEVLGMEERSYPFVVELKERAEVMLAYWDPKGVLPTSMKDYRNGKSQRSAEENIPVSGRHHPMEVWHEQLAKREKKDVIVFERNPAR